MMDFFIIIIIILNPCYILTRNCKLSLLDNVFIPRDVTHKFVFIETKVNLLLYIHLIIESVLHIAAITVILLSVSTCKHVFLFSPS